MDKYYIVVDDSDIENGYDFIDYHMFKTEKEVLYSLWEELYQTKLQNKNMTNEEILSELEGVKILEVKIKIKDITIDQDTVIDNINCIGKEKEKETLIRQKEELTIQLNDLIKRIEAYNE